MNYKLIAILSIIGAALSIPFYFLYSFDSSPQIFLLVPLILLDYLVYANLAKISNHLFLRIMSHLGLLTMFFLITVIYASKKSGILGEYYHFIARNEIIVVLAIIFLIIFAISIFQLKSKYGWLVILPAICQIAGAFQLQWGFFITLNFIANATFFFRVRYILNKEKIMEIRPPINTENSLSPTTPIQS